MDTSIYRKAESVKISGTCGKTIMRMSPFDIQSKMWAAILVVIIAFLVLFASTYNLFFPMDVQELDAPKDVYGIIFDAGSTGSRIHIFHFLNHGLGKQMKLQKDTFIEIKPGLSAYANDADKAASSLVGMLQEAMKTIPPELQHSCPIALKATAGLRLLGAETAENILNKVRELFKKYPFRMVENSVEIMSGMDEGVFSWITINYMLNLLPDAEKTVVALDLGGGSTQLTFVPLNPDTLQNSPKDFKKEISLLGKDYQLYTHSYLGLGLMSARFQMMDKIPGDPAVLTTPCFTSGITESLKKNGANYLIRGRSIENGFDPCYSIAQGLVRKNVRIVEELKLHHVMAFSYFYDRGVDSGLISVNGGNVTVNDFLQSAKKVCSQPLKNHPYLCMDLTYIYSLLHDGYTLPSEKIIQLTKKVQGIEISWALGAVFDLFAKAAI